MLNAAESPQVMIWRPDVPVASLLTGVVWSDFIALAQGNRDAWRSLTSGGTVDATNANIRAGFSSVFGGTSATITNLTAIAQRAATWLESIFTTSSVSSVYGMTATVDDVMAAMKS